MEKSARDYFQICRSFSSASPFCRFRADVARVSAPSLKKLAKVSFFVLTEGRLKLYISISNLNFLEFPSNLVDFSVSTDFRRNNRLSATNKKLTEFYEETNTVADIPDFY